MRQHSNTARLFLKLLSSWFVLLALFATATRSSPRKRVLGLGVLSGNEHPVDLDSFDESDSSIVKENGKYRIRQISILGERHSGTNWIAKHLQNCFGDAVYVKDYLTRYKHWFQDPDMKTVHPQRYNTLVIAMFRNPYDWLMAMQSRPHHAPAHLNMNHWDEFLTTPWTMDRIGLDLNASNFTLCKQGFRYSQIVSCVTAPLPQEYYNNTPRYSEDRPFYEMKQDGSGEPFANIMEMRAAKIRNMLESSDYANVVDLWPIQYEFLLAQGTKPLIDKVSLLTGIPYSCDPIDPQNRRRRPFSKRFTSYVNKHLDWNAESLIGYHKKDYFDF